MTVINPWWRVCGDAWGSRPSVLMDEYDREDIAVDGAIVAPDAASASRLMRAVLMDEGRYTWVSWQRPPLVQPVEPTEAT